MSARILWGCVFCLYANLAGAQEPSEPIEIKLGGSAMTKVQVLAFDPQKGVTLNVKGNIQTLPLSLLSKHDLYACRAALADPKKAEDQFQLGRFCFEQGLKDEAKWAFAKALNLDAAGYKEKIEALQREPKPTGQEPEIVPPKQPLKETPEDKGAKSEALGSGPATPALKKLIALVEGAGAVKAEELSDAYLDLQWQRLNGSILSGPPTGGRHQQGKDEPALHEAERTSLREWFSQSPCFRQKFLVALVPGTDRFADAARVALKLRERFPERIKSFEDLVVAFAVVWDDPKVVQAMSTHCIPELCRKPPAICSYVDSFEWMVEHEKSLCPWFRTTPWRLLTYVASDPSDLKERDWVQATYKFHSGLGTIYSRIVYDHSKLKDDRGLLGDRAYTLENLKTYGGVCRDQAYYARAVCRSFGLPAYVATGASNTSGHHAWVSWIVNEKNGYSLRDHGRYAYDKYFTAEIIEPQSGRLIYDYLVAIEAKALSDEKGYDQAEIGYRVFRELDGVAPIERRLALLKGAVESSPHHRLAWCALADATGKGELPSELASKLWGFLNQQFTDYPDFVFGMLRSFSALNKTPDKRYFFYEAASGVFNKLKRMDLVAKLRLEEVEMCRKEKRLDLAAQAAIAGVRECPDEGEQGAQLAKEMVGLLKELKNEKEAIKPLVFARGRMMKVRADHVNPYWVQVTKLLAEVYRATGDSKNAERMESDLNR